MLNIVKSVAMIREIRRCVPRISWYLACNGLKMMMMIEMVMVLLCLFEARQKPGHSVCGGMGVVLC